MKNSSFERYNARLDRGFQLYVSGFVFSNKAPKGILRVLSWALVGVPLTALLFLPSLAIMLHATIADLWDEACERD